MDYTLKGIYQKEPGKTGIRREAISFVCKRMS